MQRKPLSVYVHIPFCVQKCLYCDFVSEPASLETKRNYVNQLLKEIAFYNFDNKYIVDTIFIGGGTPSVLDADWIKAILCKLEDKFEISYDCECTIEVNPGTVDLEKLKKFRGAGVNRLSIGLQSCNDNELKALGRIHNFKTFEEMFWAARQAGFDNINVDLMSSIPEQTEESFIRSLKRVVELNPEHISVYSLIVEEGTPFYEMNLNLPDEDTEWQIYYKTGKILNENGYGQYEISNYARVGYESRHNLKYWRDEEYIGLGAAAYSYFHGVRFGNIRSLDEYLSSSDSCADIDIVDLDGEKLEYAMMHFRLSEGICLDRYYSRFGESFLQGREGKINNYISLGLMRMDNGYLFLTEQGFYVSNSILADIL